MIRVNSEKSLLSASNQASTEQLNRKFGVTNNYSLNGLFHVAMRVSDEKHEVRSCTMHACVRYIMLIFRSTGVFPVHGLHDDSIADLSYHVSVPYGMFIFIILSGQAFMAVAVLYQSVCATVTLGWVAYVVFYFAGTINAFRLFKLAHQWPKLMKSSSYTEKALSDIKRSKHIPILCKAVLLCSAALALVEHLLRKSYDLKVVMVCLGDNSSFLEVYFSYQEVSVPFVLRIVQNRWIAMFFEIFVIQSTVLWNTVDVLIICTCIYIASCFQDLNTAIYRAKSNVATNWRHLREQYSELIGLLNKNNKQLGGFVFLSLFENLFVICLQLFHSINQGKDIEYECGTKEMKDSIGRVHFIYFNFSTAYIVTKTFILLLLAARINSLAEEPMLALCYVPDSEYGLEIQRFRRQIRYTSNAISGVHFNIKKEAVVKVLTSIVTYELMMLQIRSD